MIQQFSPEMQLLVACARKTVTPADAELIVNLCQKPLDWLVLLKLVDRHLVAPLVWHSLKKIEPAAIPAQTLSALQQRVGVTIDSHTLWPCGESVSQIYTPRALKYTRYTG
jgi:hypothetical protein